MKRNDDDWSFLSAEAMFEDSAIPMAKWLAHWQDRHQRILRRHLRWMYLCFTVALVPTALSFFGDWLLWAFVAMVLWAFGMWHRRQAKKCDDVLEKLKGDAT